MKEYNQTIDIIKGLLILSVVIGHTHSPLTPYVYIFHMPAFFILSGYTNTFAGRPLIPFALQKGKSLLVPFFFANLLFFAFLFALKQAGLYHYLYTTSFSLKASVLYLITHFNISDLAGATWFLPLLFETLLVYRLLVEGTGRFKYGYLALLPVCLLIFIAGYQLLYTKKITGHYLTDLICIALFFMAVGDLYKRVTVKIPYYVHAILFPVAVSYLVYCVRHWPLAAINFPMREFGAPLFIILSSVAGMYCVVVASILIAKVRYLNMVLAYIGKRAILILIMHFFIFRIYYLLFYLLGMVEIDQLQAVVLDVRYPYWHLLVIGTIAAAMALEYPIGKSRYLSFLLMGKSDKASSN